jgi:hypothetical protein
MKMVKKYTVMFKKLSRTVCVTLRNTLDLA